MNVSAIEKSEIGSNVTTELNARVLYEGAVSRQ